MMSKQKSRSRLDRSLSLGMGESDVFNDEVVTKPPKPRTASNRRPLPIQHECNEDVEDAVKYYQDQLERNKRRDRRSSERSSSRKGEIDNQENDRSQMRYRRKLQRHQSEPLGTFVTRQQHDIKSERHSTSARSETDNVSLKKRDRHSSHDNVSIKSDSRSESRARKENGTFKSTDRREERSSRSSKKVKNKPPSSPKSELKTGFPETDSQKDLQEYEARRDRRIKRLVSESHGYEDQQIHQRGQGLTRSMSASQELENSLDEVNTSSNSFRRKFSWPSRKLIELLSPKQNGSASMSSGGSGTTNSKAHGSIKGMWKKAFRRVKSKEGENDGRERDRERTDRQSSRMEGGVGDRGERLDRSDRRSDRSDRGDDKIDNNSRSSRGSSRQSSLKKALKRRDSKEYTPPDSDPSTPIESFRDVDPVYSLLKCAADLPRQRGGPGQATGHACCLRSGALSSSSPSGQTPPSAYHSDMSVKNTSRSSSPSSVPQNSPQRTRRKLNMRMKSFSLDTPEPPKPAVNLDETTKKKSNSYQNTLYRATSNTAYTSGLHQKRSKFWNRSCSLDMEDGYESAISGHSHSPRAGNSKSSSRSNSRSNSPKNVRRSFPNNLYVVLFHFKAREKGDLDLRAGYRLTVIDSSDQDWWKGKCNGKIGYFPARYVERIHPGEKVLEVVQGLEISESGAGIKLLKEQIVLQEGEEKEGMVVIRTPDSNSRLPCPVKYLREV